MFAPILQICFVHTSCSCFDSRWDDSKGWKITLIFCGEKRLENEQNMGFEECRGEYLQKNYQIFVLGQFGVTYVIFKDKSM